MLRQLVITNTITKDKWATQFESEKVTDSQAFHHLLCYVDPGDVYTASFTNEKSDLLPAKCLYNVL